MDCLWTLFRAVIGERGADYSMLILIGAKP